MEQSLCAECGKEVHVPLNRLIRLYRARFCSKACFFQAGHFGAAPSKIQLALADKLKTQGYEVVSEFPIHAARTRVDILLPSLRTALYVDGVYWHRGTELRDQRITRRLEALDWKVIRISDAEALRIVKDKAELILPVLPKMLEV